MHCTVIGPNLHTSKIVTAISVSERLLEMAAFLYAVSFDAYYAFNTEIMRIGVFAGCKIQYINNYILTATIYCGI